MAGLRLDLNEPGWVRLYPVNFRDLESDQRFRKYDVVTLRARPARADPRVESWKPDMSSLQVLSHLDPWKPRRTHVDPYIGESMCTVLADVRATPPARSLAAVRPVRVEGVDLEPHAGWTADEQAKIDRYVGQLELWGGSDRTALEAPAMRGWYRYHCHSARCPGHRQGILDWEFVALQRRLMHLPRPELEDALRHRFYDQLCGPDRDTVFFVGNQAKRAHVFGVVGVYYPKR